MYIEKAELWRLRRFSLGAGLVLLTWSLAGVTLSPEPRITPFGLPLLIARPKLIPVGLALAAAYGAGRYFYYALSLGPSPYRIRRDLLDKLRGRPKVKLAGSFPPPCTYMDRLTDLHVSPWTSNREEMERFANDLKAAFPKFAFGRVSTKIKGQYSGEPEDSYLSYTVEAVIPIRCRVAAALLDLDYTAPIWFPLIAIAHWGLRLW